MDHLTDISSNVFVLMLLLCVISWIWEDASVISGALLAAENKLPVSLALTAVYIGICSGDLALYYLGKYAHRWRCLRARMLKNPHTRQINRRFRRHILTNIFIIRFIPGLRSIGFSLCGFWRMSLHRFIVAMCLAAAIWVALIFALVYSLGSSVWLSNSHWKWAMMLIALCLLIANNVFIHRRVKRNKLN